MKPSLGRIVIVELPIPRIAVPAIVTGVVGSDDQILATCFLPGGEVAGVEVEHDEAGTVGTWHWPPKVR